MKLLFLDTEFNGFGGELLSLALFADQGDYFYAELEPPEHIEPWVREHVMPQMLPGAMRLSRPAFDHRVRGYLMDRQGAGITIVADWPDDFVHLLECLRGPHGEALNIQFTMKYIQSGKLYPQVPHNALSDAEALARWYHEMRDSVACL